MPTASDYGRQVAPGGNKHLQRAWGTSEGLRQLWLMRGRQSKDIIHIYDDFIGTLSTALWTEGHGAASTGFIAYNTTIRGGVIQGITDTSDDLGVTLLGTSAMRASQNPGIEVRFREAETATSTLQMEIGFLNAVATAAAGTPAVSGLATPAVNTGVTDAVLATIMGDDALYGWTIASVGSGAGQVASAVAPASGIVLTPNLWHRLRLQVIGNLPSIQKVEFVGGQTGGTFTLAYPGAAANSGAITWVSSLSAATVQTAVRLITGLGTSTVTGPNGGPFYICLAGTTTPSQLLTVTNALTLVGAYPTPQVLISAIGQSFEITIDDAADAPINSQIVTITGSPTGGSMVLSYAGTSGGTVAGTNSPTAAQVQTAIRTISGLGSTLVTGASGGPYYVQLLGTTAATQLLTATNTFTGGTAPGVTIAPSQRRVVQTAITAQINPGTVLFPYIGAFSNTAAAKHVQIDSIEIWADRESTC